MQVYFIDNEDYFQRKLLYRNEDDQFFEDNDERGIFFARGVLETVKKLRWMPTIVHCHGWLSHLLPMYLKKAYRDDPLFAKTRVVVSLYNDLTTETFNKSLRDKAMAPGLKTKDMEWLEDPTALHLAKTAVQYADGIVMAAPQIDSKLETYVKERKVPILPYVDPQVPDSTYLSDYNNFYDQISGIK